MRTLAVSLLCSVVGALHLVPARADQPMVTVDADSVVAYVQSCRKSNGAFGPADQEYTDAAWNYPAVHALQLLGQKISQPELVLANGLGSPAGHVGYGHWQFFHEHQLRALLREPFSPEHETVELKHQGFEPRYYGSPFGTQGESHFKPPVGVERTTLDRGRREFGYYNLSSLYYLLAGLRASQRKVSNRAELADYIRARQAPGGGFVDVRTEDPAPRNHDAHIAHTFQALAALQLLDEPIPHADRVARFIHACQRKSGGFGRNSDPGDGQEDIYYTWAAVRALEILRQKPNRIADCTRTIQKLQNADGGFGDRPGWRSRLYSTYYAVHALHSLHGDPRLGLTRRQVTRPQVETIKDDGLKVYQALFKAPIVQPQDLPELSRRGFHLLGIKSDKFADAKPLLAACRQQRLPLDVILTPEAYPHRLSVGGGLVLNHVGNFTLDPRWTSEQQSRWLTADKAGAAGKPWNDYRDQVLRPLQDLKCICYPEQDFELEHAYVAYDEPGYNAVLAGFNWAPRDFIRVFPWRERYVTRLTPIADADAHGDLAKWSPQLDHCRMLFVARGPTYADYLEAAAAGRVVCVIVEPAGVPSGYSCYGPTPAVHFVRERLADWRWWSPGLKNDTP